VGSAVVHTTALWFKLFRRKKPDVRWTADSVIGEVGLLTAAVSEFQKGRVRFQKPILGNEEWTCVADSEIAAGERVRLTAIEGNTARVIGPEPHKKEFCIMTSLIVVGAIACSS
jgi:membrane protein implicated in regulation of membrane protease activity